jgi:hypothetical protein
MQQCSTVFDRHEVELNCAIVRHPSWPFSRNCIVSPLSPTTLSPPFAASARSSWPVTTSAACRPPGYGMASASSGPSKGGRLMSQFGDDPPPRIESMEEL